MFESNFRRQPEIATLSTLATFLSLVGMGMGAAHAQTHSNTVSTAATLGEVVVSGSRQEQAADDLPLSYDVINASTGRNSATVDKFPRAILPRSFDYGGPISIGAKDLGLYLEEARRQQAPALAVSNAAQLWALAVDRFGEDADMTRFICLLEQWAGLGEDGRPCR